MEIVSQTVMEKMIYAEVELWLECKTGRLFLSRLIKEKIDKEFENRLEKEVSLFIKQAFTNYIKDKFEEINFSEGLLMAGIKGHLNDKGYKIIKESKEIIGKPKKNKRRPK